MKEQRTVSRRLTRTEMKAVNGGSNSQRLLCAPLALCGSVLCSLWIQLGLCICGLLNVCVEPPQL
ncbi:MAG TPA: hypothetical protein VM802_23460 [Chitinophaga sp.]|uniref:hypothetical protein n=1 Tax=Chitinophaga sp. TaxID=1869181 RepID=UPI002C88011F|nr:hypothetical protein [Chitinophaga sp.]HVI47847.1 hypothetical protein [Chitinophaga sp.]